MSLFVQRKVTKSAKCKASLVKDSLFFDVQSKRTVQSMTDIMVRFYLEFFLKKHLKETTSHHLLCCCYATKLNWGLVMSKSPLYVQIFIHKINKIGLSVYNG